MSYSDGGYLGLKYEVREDYATKIGSFKNASVILMEVPEGAKPFTTRVEIEKETKEKDAKDVSIVYIMSTDINKDIEYFGGEFCSIVRRIYSYFGKVGFNLSGYYIIGKDAENYGVPDGTIWIHDMYINTNFVDFPLFSRIITKSKLNLLPIVGKFIFSEEEVEKIAGTKSLINENKVIKKIFIRREIEELEGYSTAYNRAATIFVAPEPAAIPTANLPAVVELDNGFDYGDIPELEPIEEEVVEVEDVILTKEGLISTSKKEREKEESDKLLETIKEDSKRAEMLKENIKDLFFFYVKVDDIVEQLVKARIKITKDNFYLILSFIKAKFLLDLAKDTSFQDSIAITKYQDVEKIITVISREFMKENLNL